MHAIGIQDQYIMARGGWKTDSVMKSVYRNVIDLEAAKQNKKINNHFKSMQHDMQHGWKETTYLCGLLSENNGFEPHCFHDFKALDFIRIAEKARKIKGFLFLYFIADSCIL